MGGGGSAPLPAQTRAAAPLLLARGPVRLSDSSPRPKSRRPRALLTGKPLAFRAAGLELNSSGNFQVKTKRRAVGPTGFPPGPRGPGSGPYPKAGPPAGVPPKPLGRGPADVALSAASPWPPNPRLSAVSYLAQARPFETNTDTSFPKLRRELAPRCRKPQPLVLQTSPRHGNLTRPVVGHAPSSPIGCRDYSNLGSPRPPTGMASDWSASEQARPSGPSLAGSVGLPGR